FDLQYHPGKANVVADALSRKTRCSLAYLAINDWEVVRILKEFRLEGIEAEGKVSLFQIQVQPDLVTKVIAAQQEDDEATSYKEKILNDTGLDRWTISSDNG
ncbi:hypothetical protein JQN44_27315, partial [Klebsiella pneumoniae]|nr:hypothetical protein [Klebsiella pneumoniae]